MLGSEKFGTGLLYSSNKKQVMLTSGDTCVTLFLQGILDVEAFNLSVRSRTDNTPYVVLLDPEGCTSSKLPARLDFKKGVSQEH